MVLEGHPHPWQGTAAWLKGTLQHHTLVWTLAISLLVHGALLTWRFADPSSFERVFENTSLEVVLVNARSDEVPDEAQALAQVRLAGGGQASGGAMSSTPLPPAERGESEFDIAAMNRQIAALQAQQKRLLTQLQQELSALSHETTGDALRAPERQDQQDRQERQQELPRQLARIEQQIEKTQAGPQKRFVSPATREAVYALYYDQMRRAIEARGTLNFPQVAGQKLYGQLTMVITLDHRGRILKTEVVKTSGQPLLDQRAMAIVQSVAPFEAFSANMRRQASQLVVVTRFQFLKEGQLQTHVMAAEPERP
jgi:protein TonB